MAQHGTVNKIVRFLSSMAFVCVSLIMTFKDIALKLILIPEVWGIPLHFASDSRHPISAPYPVCLFLQGSVS